MIRIKDGLHYDFEANKDTRNRLFFYIFRYGHYFHYKCKKHVLLKPIDYAIRLLYRQLFNKFNHIPLETKIGSGLRLPHLLGIVIAGTAVIGNDCTIYHGVTIGINELSGSKAPIIGNNVFIGAGAKIIGDIIVGNDVKIGANAIVTKNIPDGSTVIGVNKIIRKR